MKRLIIFAIIWPVSSWAQSLSPFNPPPMTADPVSCNQGDIYRLPNGIPKICITANTPVPIVTAPSTITPSNIPQYNGSGGLLGNGLPVSQASAPNSVIEANGSGQMDISFMPAFFPLVITNDTGTGTTNALLAKIDSSGHAVKATTTDTAIPVFVVVSGGGTSGSVSLATAGMPLCRTDAAGATVGHFIGQSTATDGRCMDLGATAPTSGWVIGQALATVAANANATVVLSQGYNSAAGGGGGGTVTSVQLNTTSLAGFTVSGGTTQTISTSGNFSLGYSTETAGLALMGPCTGGAATPTWRVLCSQDMPGVPFANILSGTNTNNLSMGGNAVFALAGNSGNVGKLQVSGDFTAPPTAGAGAIYMNFYWPTGALRGSSEFYGIHADMADPMFEGSCGFCTFNTGGGIGFYTAVFGQASSSGSIASITTGGTSTVTSSTTIPMHGPSFFITLAGITGAGCTALNGPQVGAWNATAAFTVAIATSGSCGVGGATWTLEPSPNGVEMDMNGNILTGQRNPNFIGWGMRIEDWTTSLSDQPNTELPIFIQRHSTGSVSNPSMGFRNDEGPAYMYFVAGVTAEQEEGSRFRNKAGTDIWREGKNPSNQMEWYDIVNGRSVARSTPGASSLLEVPQGIKFGDNTVQTTAGGGGGGITGPGVTTNLAIARWNGTGGTALLNGPLISTSGGSGGINAVVQASGGGQIDGAFMPIAFPLFITNDTGTGTFNQLLSKIDSSGHAVRAGLSDTTVPVYITLTGGGTSGQAQLAGSGSGVCQTDAGGAVAGHFLVLSTTTAGTCHDNMSGTIQPAGVYTVGQALTTVGPGGNVSVSIPAGYFPSTGSTTPFPANIGGTGFSSYTAGDVLVSCGTTCLAKLNNNDQVQGFINAAAPVAEGGCGILTGLDNTGGGGGKGQLNATALTLCQTVAIARYGNSGYSIHFPSGIIMMTNGSVAGQNVSLVGTQSGTPFYQPSDVRIHLTTYQGGTTFLYPTGDSGLCNGLSGCWVMKVGSTSQNTYGFESHGVVYDAQNVADRSLWLYQAIGTKLYHNSMIRANGDTAVILQGEALNVAAGNAACGSGGAIWDDNWIWGTGDLTNGLTIGTISSWEGSCSSKFGKMQIRTDGHKLGIHPVKLERTVYGVGTVNTSGTNVTLSSGTSFGSLSDGGTVTGSWAGSGISINGTTYIIASQSSSSSLNLTTSAGTQSGVVYSVLNFPAGDTNVWDSVSAAIGTRSTGILTAMSCTSGACTATFSTANPCTPTGYTGACPTWDASRVNTYDALFFSGVETAVGSGILEGRANGAFKVFITSTTTVTFTADATLTCTCGVSTFPAATVGSGILIWSGTANVFQDVVSTGFIYGDVNSSATATNAIRNYNEEFVGGNTANAIPYMKAGSWAITDPTGNTWNLNAVDQVYVTNSIRNNKLFLAGPGSTDDRLNFGSASGSAGDTYVNSPAGKLLRGWQGGAESYQFDSNQNFHLAGTYSAPAQPASLVKPSANISTTSGTPIAISWDVAIQEIGGMHSTSVNNDIWTIQTGQAGTYSIMGTVEWQGSSVGERLVDVYKNNTNGCLGLGVANGTVIAYSDYNPGGSSVVAQSFVTQWPMAPGDTIRVCAVQTSGGSLLLGAGTGSNGQTQFSVTKIN